MNSNWRATSGFTISSSWLRLGRLLYPAVICLATVLPGETSVLAVGTPGRTTASEPSAVRCVVIELFLSGEEGKDHAVQREIEQFVQQRPGLRLAIRNVKENTRHEERLQKLAKHFHFDPADLPVLYCCNQMVGCGPIRSFSRATDVARKFGANRAASLWLGRRPAIRSAALYNRDWIGRWIQSMCDVGLAVLIVNSCQFA